MRYAPRALCAGWLLGSLLVACSGGGGSPLAPESTPARPDPGAALLQQGLDYGLHPGDSLIAAYQVRIDPSTLDAAVTPIPAREATSQPPQAIAYDLDIRRFLSTEGFRVTGVALDPAGDLVVQFTHAHPFPAPTLAAPPSATNRADLGYTGRLVILADSTTRTFFDGEANLDPALVKGPDGYLPVGQLLPPGAVANSHFPYMLLTDEAKDNRVDVSNGGLPSGNYDSTPEGWQRATLASGWTGFDVIHGGQTIHNTVSLRRAALEAQLWSVTVAFLVKYTDPRGAAGVHARLPLEPANPLDFAYRLPFAALDVSALPAPPAVQLTTAPGSSAPLLVTLRDWDFGATEASDANLSDESDVRLIQPNASGAPTLELDAPFLSDTPTALTFDSGTGASDSPLVYSGTVTNTLGTAIPGAHLACLRAIDPEDDDPASINYRLGIPPDSLAPDPALALPVRTYQLVTVELAPHVHPPTIQAVRPAGVIGMPSDRVQFVADTSPDVIAWEWDFGGGAGPSPSTLQSPEVILLSAGTYTGTLTVRNADLPSAPFPFEFTVSPVPPVVPQVIDVTPTGPLGIEGDTVTFHAVVTPDVTSYLWNFGGTNPPLSTETDPTVTLLSPGVYSGTLIVNNGQADSAPFLFSLEITATPQRPRIVSVSPLDPAGRAGQQTQFSAQILYGPTAWDWDFTAGAIPSTATAPAPVVTLGAGCEWPGTLIATNAQGASDPFPFTYAVNGLAPMITAVTPSGFVGVTGDVVSFRATATEGLAFEYDWDLGGGTLPNRVSSSFSSYPVRLGPPGEYTGSVTISDEFGSGTPVPFNYTVGEYTGLDPRILSLTPMHYVGAVGDVVQYQVVAMNNPTSFEWTFNGSASILEGEGTASPLVRLDELQTLDHSVRVTNAEESVSLGFKTTLSLPDTIPTILDVAPAGEVGLSGWAVNFTLTADPPSPFWPVRWDLGGGAFELSFGMVLLSPGTYLGSAVIETTLGDSAPFPFTYTVAPNPDLSLLGRIEGAFDRHCPGDQVTFRAYTNAMVGTWFWDFGEGAFPSTSTERFPVVIMGNPGTYTGQVSVTTGAGTTGPQEFEYTIDPAAGCWNIHAAAITDAMGPSNIDRNQTAIVFNDRLAVLYAGEDGQPPAPDVFGNPSLRLAMAQTAIPTSRADWQTHVVDPSCCREQIGWGADLASIDGRLMAAYVDGGDALRVAHATVPLPDGPEDWNLHVPGVNREGSDPSLIEFNGRAMLSGPDWHTGGLMVTRAQIPSPQRFEDWRFHLVDPDSAFYYSGRNSTLVEQDGRLAIGYSRYTAEGQDSLRFARAQIEEPTCESDWRVHNVVDGSLAPAYLSYTSMVAAADRFFVACADGLDTGGLRMFRSLIPEPQDGTDWENYLIDPRTIGPVGTGNRLVVAGDHLLVSYHEHRENVRVARSNSLDPQSPADWEVHILEDLNALTGFHTDLQLLGNRPAVVCYRDGFPAPGGSSELGQVRVAIGPEGW